MFRPKPDLDYILGMPPLCMKLILSLVHRIWHAWNILLASNKGWAITIISSLGRARISKFVFHDISPHPTRSEEGGGLLTMIVMLRSGFLPDGNVGIWDGWFGGLCWSSWRRRSTACSRVEACLNVGGDISAACIARGRARVSGISCG